MHYISLRRAPLSRTMIARHGMLKSRTGILCPKKVLHQSGLDDSFGMIVLFESSFVSRRCFSSSTNSRARHQSASFPDVCLHGDLRYSSYHPRNVLDIYSPTIANEHEVVPTLLFVHGGMWLRGSKEQNTLSIYDIASHVASQAYSSLRNESTLSQESICSNHSHSNVGVCLAQHGAIACVMNYRLAGSSSGSDGESDDTIQDTGHPHQVMDVARAITFLFEKSQQDKVPLNLYIAGHSAGAHLAALVLSDPQYLQLAMKERGLDYAMLQSCLQGFIGISGVYNLGRLAMSPLAALTIEQAFGGKNKENYFKASPVQVLIHSARNTSKDTIPPLATLPVLVLNAESDFHLAQDTFELLVALNHYDDDSKSTRESIPITREAVIIENRNHFSVMRKFGSGLIRKQDEEKVTNETNHQTWTMASALSKSRDLFSTASAYISPYITNESFDDIDETAQCILKFMGLK